MHGPETCGRVFNRFGECFLRGTRQAWRALRKKLANTLHCYFFCLIRTLCHVWFLCSFRQILSWNVAIYPVTKELSFDISLGLNINAGRKLSQQSRKFCRAMSTHQHPTNQDKEASLFACQSLCNAKSKRSTVNSRFVFVWIKLATAKSIGFPFWHRIWRWLKRISIASFFMCEMGLRHNVRQIWSWYFLVIETSIGSVLLALARV